jgi:hypothetical protein
MAGATNNVDILTALNQQIQAVNDLITAVNELVLQTTVNEGDCTPEITFSPVITCTPLVTCTSYATVAAGAFGGTVVPADIGGEGGDPPPGYDPPDPETELRKCKVANFLVDSVQAVVTKLDLLDVDQYGALGFIMCAALLGGVLGSEIPIAGTLIGAVAGAIAAIAVFLVTGGAALSFADMTTMLTNNRLDLVCTLYYSITAGEAREGFVDAMIGYGATAIEAQLCAWCLPNSLTNLLFFTIGEYEAELDGWPVTTDCVECMA